MDQLVINFLKQFVTANRLDIFERVIENRTKYITVVLEDIFQSQNASAVLRTSECFGLQDIHIIENRNPFNVNPEVVMGSSNWLNLTNYNSTENNTLDAINKLKEQGYRIVATTPHNSDVDLQQFDLEKGKIALFFGTELTGLSDVMIKNADEYLKIPMFGFTESFNISVSAAIILQQLTSKLRNSAISWKLTPDEKEKLMLEWLKKSVNKSSVLISEFLSKRISI